MKNNGYGAINRRHWQKKGRGVKTFPNLPTDTNNFYGWSLISINHLYIKLKIFLGSSPVIETMMQWKVLTAFGDSTLASTIFYCLNSQQRLKRDEMPEPKLISPKDIAGNTKL